MLQQRLDEVCKGNGRGEHDWNRGNYEEGENDSDGGDDGGSSNGGEWANDGDATNEVGVSEGEFGNKNIWMT